jgi:hypothetical protein
MESLSLHSATFISSRADRKCCMHRQTYITCTFMHHAFGFCLNKQLQRVQWYRIIVRCVEA